ncbi:ATP-binding cassette domain-containing protein [Sedimenticola hydrogenitrophicus]|uniref:ATP-binding cassette domain-containing protein n=1 Tax=Sedimenticola hydrogenitrophicus TaxID=2967975 RepID=UPI0021A3AD21|nr:ATP-binding cassette domain-containing protein [Sedimenticola hydrogenitrophicus]
MSAPVLETTALSKSFRLPGRLAPALREVSLRVPAGVVTGLIGPDGAGKTTLMRLAAGLLLPDSGAIRVLGYDASRESMAVQSRIGYMPQRFGLYDDLTVQENLDLYADLQNVPPASRPTRYDELLNMTGLGRFTRRLAGQLSGGMKQKLGLACTLVRSPRLLLLDEPTVGVDPVSRRELWHIVYRLVEQEGVSVLLSTAYLDEAERCAEVILLHQGRVVGHDRPAAFSEPLRGRSFSVHQPGVLPRRLQTRLARLPGVLDATVQGEAVRLVMRQPAAPLLEESDLATARCEAVPPRFEDGFIDLLRGDTEMQPGLQPAPHNITSSQAIRVTGLTRRFGDFVAVREVSFQVSAGEVFGLLGANGAGKTTTFRMLCGLLPISGGELSVAGVDLRQAPAKARARIGYMSQKFSLYGNLTVRQNLEFFGQAYGLRGARRRTRLQWALGELDLAAFAGAPSGDLPLGYKQRLALACALMHEPDILFLDEPTSGVDPLARREFWSHINALADAGVAVLVTTHFMEEAEYCDRLAIMAAGEILALGTPAEVKARALGPQARSATMEAAFIALIESREAA